MAQMMNDKPHGRLRALLRWGTMPALALALALCMAPGGARAGGPSDSSDVCLSCHGDKSMATKRGNRTVSLYVDNKKFAGSIHSSLGCTGCHADLEGADLPHGTPKQVDCGTCHGTKPRSTPSPCMARPSPAATLWRRTASTATAITTSCR